MGLRYEAWTLPWQLDFKRKIARLPAITGTGNGSVGLFTTGNEGRVDLALGEFDRLGTVISDVEGSLVRVYDGQTIVDEWIAERVEREHSDNNKVASVSGGSIASVLDKYLIFPYDGLNPTIQGDWAWGGNIGDDDDAGGMLGNPGFENLPMPNGGFEDGNAGHWEIFQNGNIIASNDPVNAFEGNFYGTMFSLGATFDGIKYSLNGLQPGRTYTINGRLNEPTASGGRYRVGVSDAINGSHTNAYEDTEGYWWAEIGNAAQGAGSADGTWQSINIVFEATSSGAEMIIEWADPGAGPDLRVDGFTISGFQVGLLPWKPYILNFTEIFERQTTTKHSGLAALRTQSTDFVYTNPYTGQQGWARTGPYQNLNIVSGKTYTGSGWVYQASGSDKTFLLVFQRVISLGTIGSPGSSYMVSKAFVVPSGVWTFLEMTGVADTTEIRFELRWQYQGAFDTLGHQSPIWFVDDCSFYEGFPATTPGDILTILLDHAVDRGVLDWIDYSSFDDVNDSSTTPWPEVIGLQVQWGQSYGQLLDQFVDLGYEWELIPKLVPVGNLTHDLNLYISGGIDNAPATAINPKQGMSGGSVVNRIPDYTTVVVEGAGEAYSIVTDATTAANFGPLEDYIANRQLTEEATRVLAANQYLAYEAANRNAVQVEVFETLEHPRPLVDYRPGDSIPFQLPPGLAKETRRVQRIDYTNSFPTRYGITGSRLLDGEAAAYDLIWRMWRRFNRPEVGGGGGGGGGKGGHFTVQVAASDATLTSQDKADEGFVCGGASDDINILAAIAMCAGNGEVHLSEGTFNTTSKIVVPEGVTLSGRGRGTHINAAVNDDWAVDGQFGANLKDFDCSNSLGHGVRLVDVC